MAFSPASMWSPYGPMFGGAPGMGAYGPTFGAPMPYTCGTSQGNLADATVGQQGPWPFTSSVNGYGVDLNHNGTYDRGQDGVLAFDLNHDGKIDNKEIEGSNERLKAFGGNFDLNGDGSVTPCEKLQGHQYQAEMQGSDFNHDGKLEANEIAAKGGRVMVDGNQDGRFQPWEQFSPYAFPTPGFGVGSLGAVDPSGGWTQSFDTHWGWGWC